MPEDYYTFQVVLHRLDDTTQQCEAHEFKDCDPARIKTLRETVWVHGIKIEHTRTSWEVCSPFMIKSVFIIKQDKKFAL